jgi:hypothetical protein
MKTADKDVFAAMTACLRDGVTHRIRRSPTSIIAPAEEDPTRSTDERALWCEVSSSIYLPDLAAFSKGRRWSVKQAQKHGLEIASATTSTRSWPSKSTCSARARSEAGAFRRRAAASGRRVPDNIRLFAASGGRRDGGWRRNACSRCVAHAHCATDEGKRTGALDLILAYLIDERRHAVFRLRHLDAGSRTLS